MKPIQYKQLIALTLGLLTLSFSSQAAKISPLTIVESYTLPESEISGMAWRINPVSKKRELIVASDNSHKIYLIDWESRNTKFSFQAVDLKPLEVETQTEKSEWESVFSDETGRIFLIKENPPVIQVVSSDLKKIEATLQLSAGKSADLDFDWTSNSDSNAGGEGLLPLRNGHILIVKEKDPLRVIEFAPRGRKAEGYNPSLRIEEKGRFDLPKNPDIAFELVANWRLTPDHEALLEDSSGLNTDQQGRLYLLGDQKNLIGRLGDVLKPKKDTLKVEKFWSLPSEIKQPEGMVIDSELRPIIAVDRKKKDAPNVFVLSPLKDSLKTKSERR